jgi:hypothetical protein
MLAHEIPSPVLLAFVQVGIPGALISELLPPAQPGLQPDFLRLADERPITFLGQPADALAEVLDEDEKDTIPEGLTPGSYRVEEPAAIVHTLTYDLTRDPDSEPPEAA